VRGDSLQKHGSTASAPSPQPSPEGRGVSRSPAQHLRRRTRGCGGSRADCRHIDPARDLRVLDIGCGNRPSTSRTLARVDSRLFAHRIDLSAPNIAAATSAIESPISAATT
jgi:2-polyprenyl-3-methyl-5-hydroxy-6-metoxy-1,4-benzoquinol methylase